MKKWNILILLVCFCFTQTGYSWNGSIHRIIAAIAYNNLTAHAKVAVGQILNPHKPYDGRYYFIRASTWPDYLKSRGVTQYNAWHYINQAFSVDGTPLPRMSGTNIVWALQHNLKVLQNSHSTHSQQQFSLKFLIHLVGDIHQPLHCASRVSETLPYGDQGGTLFPIKNAYVNNLHQFWDMGLGFYMPIYHHQRLRLWQVNKIAKRLQREYPKARFDKAVQNLNFQQWAHACFEFSQKYAYQLKPDSRPSDSYIQLGQLIVKQQITLAGYRLSYIINRLYK